MIYITGDTHNIEDMSNLSTDYLKWCCFEQDADYHDISYAIVLGDFGLPWFSCPVDENGIHPVEKTDRYLLKWYNNKSFKVLAVQGNHDNYDMIEKLPEVEMFGSTVLKVSENVFYLKRGEVYNIEEKRFLVLGGALSEDKMYRKIHESWWPQEQWSEEEEADCLEKIRTLGEIEGGQIDYVLSHTGPTKGIVLADSYYSNEEHQKELLKDSTVAFNDKIDSMISYKKWFFGHWHSDWDYVNHAISKYVPLYRNGVVL